ncbi:glycosyl hydrolase family 85-domain-containing protein [Chytriomyces sp. MP71]|nr:glycosyl hydrolase family 85-domain-containing protein [Chytriomyces sp. MP71]
MQTEMKAPRLRPIERVSDLGNWSASEEDALHVSTVPRPLRAAVKGHDHARGKVLVCHDMANGYRDDAFSQGLISEDDEARRNYSFAHWNLVDEFIYFSHHRFSLPPSTWTNAAHRNGVLVYVG